MPKSGRDPGKFQTAVWISWGGVKPPTGYALSRPTPRVQPKEDQSSPRGHEADAQSLISLPHAVQGKREPHHDEAGQGQKVHAEENVPGEHRAALGGVLPMRADTTAFAKPRHAVHLPGHRAPPEYFAEWKAAERWLGNNPARRIVDKKSSTVAVRRSGGEEIDDLLNGFVGAVVGGFEFAVRLMIDVGAMVKAAVGEWSAEAFVEEEKE
jgi:hypothetical protein